MQWIFHDKQKLIDYALFFFDTFEHLILLEPC